MESTYLDPTNQQTHLSQVFLTRQFVSSPNHTIHSFHEINFTFYKWYDIPLVLVKQG